MAKKAAAAPAFQEGVEYDVKLKAVVKIIGTTYLPLPVHRMDGWLVNQIVAQEGADVLDTASPRA